MYMHANFVIILSTYGIQTSKDDCQMAELYFNVWSACLLSQALILVLAAEAIQCFHCSGMTNYDPDGCFHPDSKVLLSHECDRGDSCEVNSS